MALIAPTQERSVDPISDNRFSSVINRFSRILTNGMDVILFPNQSFKFEIVDWNKLLVKNGICIKDDVFIHITEDFNLMLDDNEYYIDDTGDMTSDGYYYIVLQYFYARSFVAPKAYIRIIRDKAIHFLPYQSRYIFLGCLDIHYNSLQLRYEINPNNGIFYYDPENPTIKRPESENSWLYIDGGEIL